MSATATTSHIATWQLLPQRHRYHHVGYCHHVTDTGSITAALPWRHGYHLGGSCHHVTGSITAASSTSQVASHRYYRLVCPSVCKLFRFRLTPPTVFIQFTWNLVGALLARSRCACGFCFQVWQLYVELCPLKWLKLLILVFFAVSG